MADCSPIVDVSRTSSVGGLLPLKLNLGGDNVDIATDLSDLSMVESGSVEEIYASHCLEHFSHLKTVDVLKEWRRVMKKGCKAYIAVPDLEVTARMILKDGLSDWAINFLYGDQVYDKAYHYTAFDFPRLAKCLVKAGWSDVKRIVDMPYKLDDCSWLRYSNGGERVSLNVEAIA
jgi:ubiquinone/menaquinone biosynthesis C-methylase UbiE